MELVKYRNITETADRMFLSQPVVSNRLKNLETELGDQLFIRSKGIREITLTRKGEDFVPIALRWKALFEETELLGKTSLHCLRIATNESTYYEILVPVIIRLLKEYPDFRIDVQVVESTTVYDLVEKTLVDYGFASYESSRPKLKHCCIDSQQMCVVQFKEDPGPPITISPSVLDPKKEICLSGGHFLNMRMWREKWFGTQRNSRFEINSFQSLPLSIWRELDGWILAPISAVKVMREKIPLQICYLDDPPENRNIYLLQNEDLMASKHPCFEIFESILFDYLDTRDVLLCEPVTG